MKRTTLPIILAVLAMLATLVSACGEDVSDPSDRNWRLVWQDEFEGAKDQLPDSTRWTYDIGTDWGNAQLEYDTDRPENVSLDGNGNLVITARKESYLGRGYTSARIVTRGLFERTHGKYEARIWLPYGRGIWPAFWLLGSDLETVGWPDCGEIDILEYRGQEVSTVHGTLHGPGYSAAQGVTRRFDLNKDRFDTGFHTFAIEWSEDSIDWFVDGTRYHSVGPDDVSGEWVFNHPFYIILNVAVGGGWVGAPDGNTVFPQKMLVDWVRVYEEIP